MALTTHRLTSVIQVGQNRSDCVILSADIVDSLTKIRDCLESQSVAPSPELCDSISEFENELNRIFARQQRLGKKGKGGVLGSLSKAKEMYNADDVRNELYDLRQRVQTRSQSLLLSSTIRTETKVAVMSEQVLAVRQNQAATDRRMDMIINSLIPGLNGTRKATLDRIEVKVQERMGADDHLQPGLQNFHARDASRNSISLSSKRSSIGTSLLERRFLKGKVKELAGALPPIPDQPSRPQTFSRFNPFRGSAPVAPWESDDLTTRTRGESIQETLRISSILRSDKKVQHGDLARDLLRLAKALGDLGLWEETGVIYDWAIQICCEISKNSNGKTLFSLASFIHKTFLEIATQGKAEDAQRILEQGAEVRRQLEVLNETEYLAKIATSLNSIFEELLKGGHIEICLKVGREVSHTYRYL
ncbi:hypothetical protein FRC02_007743, partial [Tulasnella sp. 418]